MTTNTISTIPLDRIHGNPGDRTADEELVASVQQHGVLEPIAVIEDGDGYRPLFGCRRLDAARKAGLDAIACVVYHADLPADQQRVLLIVENLQRLDNSPIEQGRAFLELVALGVPQEEVAKRIGKPRHFVHARVRLASLPPAVLDRLPPSYNISAVVELGKLSEEALLSVLDETPGAASDLELARDAVRRAGRSLDAASFSTDACATCGRKEDVLCLDPSCFDQRQRDAAEAAIAQLREEHPEAECVVSREGVRNATPATMELVSDHCAHSLRKRRIVAGEDGEAAILLDGGTPRLVHVAEGSDCADGRATRHTEQGQRSLDLRRRLQDAAEAPPRAVRPSDLPRLARSLGEALEGRSGLSVTCAWAAVFRACVPALAKRLQSAPTDADFTRIEALLP